MFQGTTLLPPSPDQPLVHKADHWLAPSKKAGAQSDRSQAAALLPEGLMCLEQNEREHSLGDHIEDHIQEDLDGLEEHVDDRHETEHAEGPEDPAVLRSHNAADQSSNDHEHIETDDAENLAELGTSDTTEVEEKQRGGDDPVDVTRPEEDATIVSADEVATLGGHVQVGQSSATVDHQGCVVEFTRAILRLVGEVAAHDEAEEQKCEAHEQDVRRHLLNHLYHGSSLGSLSDERRSSPC